MTFSAGTYLALPTATLQSTCVVLRWRRDLDHHVRRIEFVVKVGLHADHVRNLRCADLVDGRNNLEREIDVRR